MPTSAALRRLARPILPAVAIASWALASGPAHPVRAVTTPPPPALVRDVNTGYDALGAIQQAATPNDYIQPDTQIEPSIAVNPANPDNVVVGYQEGRVSQGGDATNGFATTKDGGRTWKYGEPPGLTSIPGPAGGGTFDRGSDAVVAFGPDNTVYFSSLIFNDVTSPDPTGTAGATRSGMSVNVSHDGGLTWSPPAIFQDDNLAGLNDKNWIVVDQSDAPGHHKGRVYVLWDRVAPILYSYCDTGCENADNWLANPGVGGQHFIPIPAYVNQGIGCIPMVLPDGTLGVVLNSAAATVPPGAAQGSVDANHAGATQLTYIQAPMAGSIPSGAPLVWSPVAVGIASNLTNGARAQRAAGLPAADVDRATGQLYVAWEDGRQRTDAEAAENDIMVSTSTDKGLTWSTPTRVNKGPENDHVNRYNAMIAVSPDGIVHAAYRQRTEGTALKDFSTTIGTYYQESYDHGATWTAPLSVGTVANNVNYSAQSRDGAFQGDYNEIASAGGSTYIVREESYPLYAGEPVALTEDPANAGKLILTGKGHQHQRNWVAVVRNVAPTTTTTTGSTTTPASGPVTAASQGLANTGGTRPSGGAVAAALAALAAVVWAVRRRGRTRRQ